MKSVYVYEAIRRNKENPSFQGERCIREVDWQDNEAETVARLKEKTSRLPGVWRIYRTVNRRDVRKAQIELAKTLIDIVSGDNATTKSVESLWKTILCQPRNKAERLWLLDIDDPTKAFVGPGCQTIDGRPTPHGFHIVCEPFDLSKWAKPDFIEVKKDALLFIERYEVK